MGIFQVFYAKLYSVVTCDDSILKSKKVFLLSSNEVSDMVYVVKDDILKLHKCANNAYHWVKYGYNLTTCINSKIGKMTQFIQVIINYIQPNYTSFWQKVPLKDLTYIFCLQYFISQTL